MARMFLSRMS